MKTKKDAQNEEKIANYLKVSINCCTFAANFKFLQLCGLKMKQKRK